MTPPRHAYTQYITTAQYLTCHKVSGYTYVRYCTSAQRVSTCHIEGRGATGLTDSSRQPTWHVELYTCVQIQHGHRGHQSTGRAFRVSKGYYSSVTHATCTGDTVTCYVPTGTCAQNAIIQLSTYSTRRTITQLLGAYLQYYSITQYAQKRGDTSRTPHLQATR